MKIFGIIKKYPVIKKAAFFVLVTAAFFLPLFVTYYTLARADRIKEEEEKILTAGAGAKRNVKAIGIGSSGNGMELIEPEAAEKDVRGLDLLTMSGENSTSGDASPADADKSTESDENADSEMNGRTVYLTFDDGPSETTGELLDILKEEDVKATFFVVVNNYKYKSELNRILDEGHTLGLHSESHIYEKIYADFDSFKADVKGVHDWVEKLTGFDAKYYRFPGGSSNNVSCVPISECIEYLHENGYEYIDWNAASRDAENLYLSPDQLNQNVMSYVHNSDGDVVVLMHDLDDHYNTVSALPDLIHTLKQEGFRIAPIDDKAPLVQHYVP